MLPPKILILTAWLRGWKGLTPFWQKGIRAPWPAHAEVCLWCWSLGSSWLEKIQWEKRTKTHIRLCLCLPEEMCCHSLAGLPGPLKSGLISSIWERQKSKKLLSSHKHHQSWSVFSPFGYTSNVYNINQPLHVEWQSLRRWGHMQGKRQSIFALTVGGLWDKAPFLHLTPELVT